MASASRRPDTKATPPKKASLRPEINVTPLVDVVLVLLIIFMVISPQLESGEAVELPKATNVAKPDEREAVTVTLTTAGRTLVERELVPEAELEQHLTSRREARSTDRLVVKADRAVGYGAVKSLLATGQRAGFRHVSLTVEEPATGSGG